MQSCFWHSRCLEAAQLQHMHSCASRLVPSSVAIHSSPTCLIPLRTPRDSGASSIDSAVCILPPSYPPSSASPPPFAITAQSMRARFGCPSSCHPCFAPTATVGPHPCATKLTSPGHFLSPPYPSAHPISEPCLKPSRSSITTCPSRSPIVCGRPCPSGSSPLSVSSPRSSLRTNALSCRGSTSPWSWVAWPCLSSTLAIVSGS
ncbi:uncharacterized protein BJ171DRAFT_98710 [Polychytrium aggregatum]|uniref:uncharacterized protein n=1 Tax=Polychytrium aggregatum TaxID=110093 RepID=UPI0022FDEA0D|nr:uncharacterized protein BJ171DRAFT_98710 [Polychytrium aggregatum]KAI9204618.1 hypothetical protein BJ171DRAFT_98710 [Polychytrium aggregatum]